jgi:hypothetical protein
MRSVLVLKLRNTIPSQLKITNAIGTVSLADLDRVLRDPVANDADRADEST